MGIAAGGKITQKIYEDTNSPLVYDVENPSRAFVHTVSTAAWEVRRFYVIGEFLFMSLSTQLITGVVCPMTPKAPCNVLPR